MIFCVLNWKISIDKNAMKTIIGNSLRPVSRTLTWTELHPIPANKCMVKVNNKNTQKHQNDIIHSPLVSFIANSDHISFL